MCVMLGGMVFAWVASTVVGSTCPQEKEYSLCSTTFNHRKRMSLEFYALDTIVSRVIPRSV